MAGCPLMAQTMYLARHNAITSGVCVVVGVVRGRIGGGSTNQSQCWKMTVSKFCSYDFNIFTDIWISAWLHDPVLIDKEAMSKENEKVDKNLLNCNVYGTPEWKLCLSLLEL